MRGVAGFVWKGRVPARPLFPKCRAGCWWAARIASFGGSQTRPMWFAPPTVREGAFSLPLRKADKHANLMGDLRKRNKRL